MYVWRIVSEMLAFILTFLGRDCQGTEEQVTDKLVDIRTKFS